MQKFLTRLMSDPRFKEALHRRMRKLEKKLECLASLYFDQKINIIYVNELSRDKLKKGKLR